MFRHVLNVAARQMHINSYTQLALEIKPPAQTCGDPLNTSAWEPGCVSMDTDPGSPVHQLVSFGGRFKTTVVLVSPHSFYFFIYLFHFYSFNCSMLS